MKIYDHHITECDSAIPAILVTHFLISEETAYYLYKGALKSHFDRIRENVKMVIETDYVDKFYRNSYYNYYASKLNTFQRNCIKVSFFEDSITMDDFRLRESLDKIKGSYLGFFLLRPTEPSLLGRSVLSPKALKENNFVACTASIPTTSNAIRLQAVGFPHSSQDNETLKCAEVTIWAVLEYFGNKYPDYVSVLPSAIMQKLKDVSEALFYVKETTENSWSRAVLEYQIETNLYSRQGKAITNFKETLPEIESDLANALLKDPYNFEFLTLSNKVKERDLETQLIANITQFLLELGKGFAYLGRQFTITIGGKEFKTDLLFYHTRLKCYVVIELKVTEFEPEFLGKLNFYLSAVNRLVKADDDKPTIGILLCKSKNNLVVDFALQDINKPLGVSEYTHTQLPAELREALPTIEELTEQLNKEDERILE